MRFLTVIFLILSGEAFAVTKSEGFFVRHAISLEYSVPNVVSGGANSELDNNRLSRQITDFENIALGGNLRVHKSFLALTLIGHKLNWRAKHCKMLILISGNARFKLDQYNLSTLLYTPLDESFEPFIKLGARYLRSKLSYVNTAGTVYNRKV